MRPKPPIKNIISRHESATLELKSSLTDWKSIVQTISSFSNAKGGTVLVGVKDDGTVIGVQLGKRTLEALANEIRQNTDPAVFPRISMEDVEGKTVIVIEVEESKTKPVFAFDKVFKRVGKSDHRVTSAEIRKMALEGRKVYWDHQICEEASLDDIDETKVKWYLEKRETIRKIPKEIDPKTLLINIGAAKEVNNEVKLTNAGITFFGKNSQRYIPQRIIGARFKGKELSRTTTDSIDCSGTLWEMVESAEDFVRKNIRLFGFRTEFSFRRIDKLEYPIEAIREAIINSLIHRDFFEPADVRLFIFDNRIEIINPGSFPKGVTPKKPTHKPRNPILCQLMRDVGLIEKYGSGIYFMRGLCKDWGLSEPEYDISKIETKITFRSGGEAIVIPEIEKLGVDLNGRQRSALEHIYTKGHITRSEYMELAGVSHKTAHKDLKELVRKGLVAQDRKGRATRYLKKL